MKRYLSLFVFGLFALSLSLFGCKQSQKGEVTQPKSQSPQEQQQQSSQPQKQAPEQQPQGQQPQEGTSGQTQQPGQQQ